MERILSDDEKIKRAEEIYYRRNNSNVNISSNNINKKGSIKDKFFLHLIIMFNIAILIFAIQNREYIFKEEFLEKVNEYNLNISSNITSYIKELVSEENNLVEDNLEKETINAVDEIKIDKEIDNKQEEISSTLTEMDLDIENIKNAYSLITPLDGIITSGFGARQSEHVNVSGYHTGIDIAANKGTNIKASMEGIVDLVSSEGDYGNHIKIRCNNVTTLYAHCQNIYVQKGQIVAQGQDIATVGSTGNSTGPHLHFEIRVDDRFVNPSKILNLEG